MIDCTFEKSNSSDTSGFCLEDVWTIRSLVMQEESHAYFRNPSHLINSLDARKYDTKSHVLDPQWAKNNYKISAKRVNYKIERLIVYHGTQIHHTHKDQMDFLTLKPPPWLSFRFCSQFLMDNPMLWSKCLISFVCKE